MTLSKDIIDEDANLLMNEYKHLQNEIAELRQTIFDYPESEQEAQTIKIEMAKKAMFEVKTKVRSFPSYLINDQSLRESFERETPKVRDTYLFSYA